MNIFTKLFKIFGRDVNKKLTTYLLTNNIEDLKDIDREIILKQIYNISKQITIMDNSIKTSEESYKSYNNTFYNRMAHIEQNTDENGFNFNKSDTTAESYITQTEFIKSNRDIAKETLDTLVESQNNLKLELDKLVQALNSYDALIERKSAELQLNKSRKALAKLKKSNFKVSSSVESSLTALNSEMEIDIKTEQLVDSVLNPAAVKVKSVSIEDRIKALKS